MTRCPCSRCGAEQDHVEVTTYGDTKHRYMVTSECNCPSPRCPFCSTRTDDGWCWNLDCFMVGQVIPGPRVQVMSRHYLTCADACVVPSELLASASGAALRLDAGGIMRVRDTDTPATRTATPVRRVDGHALRHSRWQAVRPTILELGNRVALDT